MAEDELGSFFEEINQIQDAAVETGSVEPEASDQPETKRPRVFESVVVSKPAERIEKVESSSHPVYVYPESEYSAFETTAGSSTGGTADTQYNQWNNISSLAAVVAPSSAPTGPVPGPQAPRQNKKFVRTGAGEIWTDDSLNEWPENDFRIFVGDLGKEVTTEMLSKQFQCYKSFAKAKVVRTKNENKARGYGFVSFLDPMECAKAIREMNGQYIGTRPMKISKSSWKERDIKEVHKKDKKKRKVQESLGLA